MGLSAFEECSTSPPYCSPSIDRSLTTRLIESSNIPSKISSRFAHTPEWADGLDVWPLSHLNTTKTDISRRHFDFHNDLGLFLPRHEKPNSAPTSFKNLQINSKMTTNNLPPERIRQLLKKEKDLLSQNDLSNRPLITDDPPLLSLVPPLPPPVPANTFRQSTSMETQTTNDIRLPLRHIITKASSSTSSSSSPPPLQQQQQQILSTTPLNQDALKSLLKEHLTSLLTRGASTINSNRTLINIPSFDIKQQIRIESKSIDDIPTSIQQIKSNQTSPLIFHPRSTLGLTVTPVDLCSQRNLPAVSLEKMAQQRNYIPDSDTSSVSSSRPSTQPNPLPSSTTHLYQQQQQQRVILRRNLETTNSSSGEICQSNDNINKLPEQVQSIQNNRKGPSTHNRSTSKTGSHHRPTVPTTTTTIELLPPIISGKRLHIPLANHRYL